MKILVVDREEDLPLAVAILESAPGNEVKTATSGEQALEITSGQDIDLLITEVFIEPMNGFTLRNKMENRHRGIRTIFLSGYDLAPYKEHTEGYEVVSKPATPQKLLPAIARATVGMVKKPVAAAAPAQPKVAAPAPEAPTAPVAEVKPPVAEAKKTQRIAAAPVPAKVEPPKETEPPKEVAPAPATVKVPDAEAISSEEEIVEAAKVPEPAPVPVAPEPPKLPEAKVPEPKAPEPEAKAPEPAPLVEKSPEPVVAREPEPAPMPEPVAPAAPEMTVSAFAPAPASEASPVVKSVPQPAPGPAPSIQLSPRPQSAEGAVSGKGVPIVLPPKPTAEEAAKIAMKVAAAAAPRSEAPAEAAAAVPAAPAVTEAAPPPAKPTVKAVSGADPMIGRTIGAYRIERRLGNGHWGTVYLANQISMNRPVAMELLAPERAADSKARDAFVATARAKAAVQHPHILSVYEADQAEGFLFYTHEYVDGATVEQMAAKKQTISDHVALQTIKYVAQALAHLDQHGVAHSIPEASDVYVGKDGLPYISNVAQQGKDLPPVQEEICTIAEMIRSVLPEGDAEDPGLRAMLTRMGITNQMGFQSWPPLFQAIQTIEPKVVPADAFKLSAQDEAAIRAVDQARRKQRNALISSLGGMVVFLALLAGVIWWQFLRPISHDFTNEMVKVSDGYFIYQDGQQVTLPTFYIDKYEVTIGEYGKFLQYLQDHDYPVDYDSPLQPKGLSHVPRDWDIYFGRAGANFAKYRNVKGVPITLDCPVINVTYFDAYAYAKWKGHRLPTQQEWEKAARGPFGNLYPWGNVWDPTKLNSGSDFQAEPVAPGYKATVDGFNWWNPVDAVITDKSYYGAIGMAGNVSEWTESWDPSKTFAYIRGGNYKSNSAQAMLSTQIKAYPTVYTETLGFRTVSDTPPPEK